MEDDRGFSTKSVFLSFLLGGILGAGMALILAPQSGRETRGKIKETADDVKEKAQVYVQEAKGKIFSTLDKAKETLEEKKSAITKALEAGKEAYEKEVSKEKEQEG
ncbi:YtxH domain-containing protein [Thermodesulfovibrio thiophilus]|uniref:YtxH domain-containing protein n=1 Tax=Thermodesulfovibrio thiophilus TaxID=340095 RepID=UPI0017FED6BF|nr:YtxH domain-containing protein [Thermodesulfovibrio thiophilus]HHW19995.1 YtxH domain-containing protein [Thermodesulfovibrio thiophilus]